jgi:tRNA(Ile)-lysidine synthetase-like protein
MKKGFLKKNKIFSINLLYLLSLIPIIIFAFYKNGLVVYKAGELSLFLSLQYIIIPIIIVVLSYVFETYYYLTIKKDDDLNNVINSIVPYANVLCYLVCGPMNKLFITIPILVLLDVVLKFIENKVTANNNSVSFKIDDLLSLDEDIRIHVLFRVLKKYSLSRVCLDDIYKQIISKKQNIVTRINNELSMIKEYGTIIFTEDDISKQEFNLKIDNDGVYKLLDNQKIKVDKNICYLSATSKTLWYNIKSFPIIIRTRVDGDKIKLKTGTKSVSDFLTDKKVPYMQRKDTLVLCDEFDNILYILGYITR